MHASIGQPHNIHRAEAARLTKGTSCAMHDGNRGRGRGRPVPPVSISTLVESNAPNGDEPSPPRRLWCPAHRSVRATGSRLASILPLIVALFIIPTLLLTGCGTGDQTAEQEQLYTCGMHPQVIQNKPGNCPIC